ncbi:MAG: hypothetical protein ACRCY8_09925 [Dermatophilaceae bacterium]
MTTSATRTTTAPNDTRAPARRRRRAGKTTPPDNLTAEQQATIDELRAAVDAVNVAAEVLRAAITTRQRTVQDHEDAITAIGWRRTARILGLSNDSTLRLDARTRIDPRP